MPLGARRLLRQLAGAAALLYVAAAGGELLANWLFVEHPSSPAPAPASSTSAAADALSAVPPAAAVLPAPPPATPSPTPAVNPRCPAYAIPTTGHRSELTQLLEQLVHGAGVRGSRVHLFVDMTAMVADHKLLSQLQKSFGVHVHHRSKQVQDTQKTTRPALPWPPASKSADDRDDVFGADGVDMVRAVSLWHHYAFMLDTMFGAVSGAATRPVDGQGARTPAAPFGTEYVAILEDDLSVSVDIDSYFCRMTYAMAGDDTVLSVSTHNDAGFWPTAADPRMVIRHEHFAQPGWMTSRQMYERHIRPRWVGPVYGHWDLAMQYLVPLLHTMQTVSLVSLSLSLCVCVTYVLPRAQVYGQGSPVPASEHSNDPAWTNAPPPGSLHTLAPEVPRTLHRSSMDALTVGKSGYGSQLLDFANIRLNVDRVDWQRVPIDAVSSQEAYDRHIKEHLASDDTAYLDCLRGGGHRYAAQGKPLVALVPCRADNDRRCWDEVLLQHFHLYGVGLGEVPRGVYKGTVFVRWLKNRLLLVAAYSPFIREPSPAAWLARSQQGSRMSLSSSCDRPENIKASLLKDPPLGVIPAVGKIGQNCHQVCAGLKSSSEGARLVTAAAAAVSASTGTARTSAMTVSCDAGLLPLVNPREPNGESPFCGGAFHPFLLDTLSSHLPRTGASKLLPHASSTSVIASAAVVPCKTIEELGYPAVVKDTGSGVDRGAAGKRLLTTNHRLLNCSAHAPEKGANRLCTCVVNLRPG